MKKTVSMVLAILMLHLSVSGVYAQSPEFIELKQGTKVHIRLTSDISSDKTNQATAAVVANIVDKSTKKVLIAQGTPVQLRVHTQKSKGMGKGGNIGVLVVSTIAVDGSTVMLHGGISREWR